MSTRTTRHTACALRALALAPALCLGAPAAAQVVFTHDVGTTGAPGSGVELMPDEASIFDAHAGTNTPAAHSVLDLGLLPGDNINALDRDGFAPTNFGALAHPFMFSVDPGAAGRPGWPVFDEAPDNPGDVYVLTTAPGHLLGYQEASLGLMPNAVDSIDGLARRQLVHGERIFFSLKRGSPTLGLHGWSAADILTVVVGDPLSLARSMHADQLGLFDSDDVDALVVEDPFNPAGDGVFMGPWDTATVYFSVTQDSEGMPGTDVHARSGTVGAGADVFFTGLAGTNTLLYPGDRWTRLAPGDTLGALKRGDTDPAGAFPLMVPRPPPTPPNEPPDEPPYPGPGVPIGQIYVQVCDNALPNLVHWSLGLKLCNRQGETDVIWSGGQFRGFFGGRGEQKARLIAEVLRGATITKEDEDGEEVTIPVFDDVRINVPSESVDHSAIVAEVCATVSQEFVDCGWDLDAICFSLSRWTAWIILEPLHNMEFPGARRLGTVWFEDVPEEDGVFGISAGDFTDPDDPVILRYEVPFGAGDDPAGITGAMAEQIVGSGGHVRLTDDGRLTVLSLPVEPPPDDRGVVGPFIWEAGALENGVIVNLESELARMPGTPCNAADIAPPFGTLDIFDVLEFLDRFAEGSPRADYAAPRGVLDIFDVLRFLEIFAQGCPPMDDL